MLENNFEMLKNDIIQQAQLEIDQINYEIELLHKSFIDTFVQGLEKETETFLESELKELRLKEITLSAKNKLQVRRDLQGVRDQLVQKLFNELKNRLISFKNSEQYQIYLKNKIAMIDIRKGVIKCLKDDQSLIKGLIDNKDVSFETINLEIGGFIYHDIANNNLYDLTLDQALLNQLDYFRNNSKFLL